MKTIFYHYIYIEFIMAENLPVASPVDEGNESIAVANPVAGAEPQNIDVNGYSLIVGPKIVPGDAIDQLITAFEQTDNEHLPPQGYVKRSTIVENSARVAKFFTQRTINPGIIGDGDVDRLMFRNQMFIKFIDKKYLFDNQYVENENEYNAMIGEPNINHILDEKVGGFTPGTKVSILFNPKLLLDREIEGRVTAIAGTKTEGDDVKNYYWVEYFAEGLDQPDYGDGVNRPTAMTTGHVVYQYPILEDRLKIVNTNTFYKLNDQKNVPFTNVKLFEFLHMYKHVLKNAFAKMRISLVYNVLDLLSRSLNVKVFENNTVSTDPYFSTFHYSVTNVLSKDLKAAFGSNDTCGNENPEQNAMVSVIQTAANAKNMNPEEQNKMLNEAIDKQAETDTTEENSPETSIPPPNETVPPAQGGGKKSRRNNQGNNKTQNRRKHKRSKKQNKVKKGGKKTKKIRGGAFSIPNMGIKSTLTQGSKNAALSMNPVYRKLSKYVDTWNIMNNTDTNADIPYLIPEQKRFLALAIMYFKRQAGDNTLPRIVLSQVDEQAPAVEGETVINVFDKNVFVFTPENEVSNITTIIDDFIATTEYKENDIVTIKKMIDYVYELGNGKKAWIQQGGLFGRQLISDERKQSLKTGFNKATLGVQSMASSAASKISSAASNAASFVDNKLGVTSGISSANNYASAKIKSANEFYDTNAPGKWKRDIEKLFHFSFKRMTFDLIQGLYNTDDKKQVIEFIQTFTWCNLMTPHFTCNNVVNWALGFWTPPGVQTPHCYISGIITLIVIMTINPFSLNELLGKNDAALKNENIQNAKQQYIQMQNEKNETPVEAVAAPIDNSMVQPAEVMPTEVMPTEVMPTDVIPAEVTPEQMVDAEKIAKEIPPAELQQATQEVPPEQAPQV
jgi:hypothetical protein